MPLIFTTRKDSPYDVEIAGGGVLGGSAKGGLAVERAAEYVRELQDEEGKPLSGKKLEAAAEAFAEARGLSTKSLQKLDEGVEEKLRVEAGALPSPRRIEDVSREAAERDGAFFEAIAENPDAAIIAADQLPPQPVNPQPSMPNQP